MAGATLVTALPAAGQAPDTVRRVIRGLSFEGNQALDDNTLAISIATTNSTPFWQTFAPVRWLGIGQKRFFDEREFRRDVLRLKFLYDRSGYPDAVIDTLVLPTDGAVSIRFRVYEGDPIRVADIALSGVDSILAPRRLLRDLPLRVGDPFNRFLLLASADSLGVALQNEGYPFVRVFRNFVVDRERGSASVAFEVDPGPQARIAAVHVVGTEAIDERDVRRLIPVRRGAVYRLDDLFESQRALYQRDMFDYVNVRLEDSLPDGPDDSLVTVRVQVIESELHRIRAGAGYGSLDCFRGLLGWTAADFLGDARTLDITGRVSKIGTGAPFGFGLQENVCFPLRTEQDSSRLDLNYNLTVTLNEPYLFSRRNSGTIALFAERRSEFRAYLREAFGGELGFTRQSRLDIPVTLTYQLLFGSTEAEPATFCTFLNVCLADDTVFTKRLIRSTVGLTAVRDRSDSRLDPTRGSRIVGEVRWASPLIGSDTLAQFTRAVGEIASYHRVGRRGVFAWRTRVGALVPPRLGFQGQGVQFVPPDERFYGGGPNTVRGFGQNQLGPLVRVLEPDPRATVTLEDAAGVAREFPGFRLRTSATGGNQLLVFNVELRFPLPLFAGRLFGASFVDAGQVFEQDDNLMSVGDIRVTPGVGLRLASPLGPVRLDVAYNGYNETLGPLYRLEGERLVLEGDALRPPRPTGVFNRLQVHFSVGQPF